jgi:hypothetical protein
MNRREVMALLGGAAAWPHVASAQQTGGMRRVGMLMGWSESDPEYHLRVDAVIQGLAQTGWSEGRNILFDVRWTNGDVQRAQSLAKELVALQPDVIIAGARLRPPRCSARPIPSRSCSRSFPILSARALWPAYRGQAVTSRASSTWNPRWWASNWSS